MCITGLGRACAEPTVSVTPGAPATVVSAPAARPPSAGALAPVEGQQPNTLRFHDTDPISTDLVPVTDYGCIRIFGPSRFRRAIVEDLRHLYENTTTGRGLFERYQGAHDAVAGFAKEEGGYRRVRIYPPSENRAPSFRGLPYRCADTKPVIAEGTPIYSRVPPLADELAPAWYEIGRESFEPPVLDARVGVTGCDLAASAVDWHTHPDPRRRGCCADIFINPTLEARLCTGSAPSLGGAAGGLTWMWVSARELLFHELVHATRMAWGEACRPGGLDSMYGAFENREEFCTITGDDDDVWSALCENSLHAEEGRAQRIDHNVAALRWQESSGDWNEWDIIADVVSPWTPPSGARSVFG